MGVSTDRQAALGFAGGKFLQRCFCQPRTSRRPRASCWPRTAHWPPATRWPCTLHPAPFAPTSGASSPGLTSLFSPGLPSCIIFWKYSALRLMGHHWDWTKLCYSPECVFIQSPLSGRYLRQFQSTIARNGNSELLSFMEKTTCSENCGNFKLLLWIAWKLCKFGVKGSMKMCNGADICAIIWRKLLHLDLGP